MQHIEFRIATAADTTILIQHRLDFLRIIYGDQPAEKVAAVAAQMLEYFPRAIASQQFYGVVATKDGNVAGTGSIIVNDRPANYNRLNGKVGYILNMYTLPAYRRMGVGSGVLQKLIDVAKELQLDVVDLHASEDGAPLYGKYGFVVNGEKSMSLKLR